MRSETSILGLKQIQKEHVALIIKYTGISFITWWLSHGFFSGERQIITSLVGVVFFIVWTLLEQKPDERDYMRTIIFSSILAVAIWALTWWLQHFPDSPDRSVWLVPVWFLVSIGAYLALEKEVFYKKTHLIYTIVGFIFFIGVSVLLYSLVQAWYLWASEHGHATDAHHDWGNIVIEEQRIEWSTPTDFEVFEDTDSNFKWDGHTDHNH